MDRAIVGLVILVLTLLGFGVYRYEEPTSIHVDVFCEVGNEAVIEQRLTETARYAQVYDPGEVFIGSDYVKIGGRRIHLSNCIINKYEATQ